MTADHTSATTATIDAATVSAKVDPAVVNINTVLDPLEGGGTAAGTGMIITANGEIVTNNHVVQGADTITVSIPGHGRHAAQVIGTVPTKDVALLKVTGLSHLPTVHFGNSATAVVGTPVVAIGNALGLGGSPTVTTGAITATGRTITAADATGANQETLHGLLQMDAEIVPGNSGGPLVNAAAQVVGMDTAAASAGTTAASVGFAIPSNTVKTIAGQLAAHKALTGYVYGRKAFLGVEVVDSSQVQGGVGTSGNPFGFGFGFGPVATTPNGTPGVVVAAVDPGSGAAKAGLVSGDVITAVDGTATPSTAALSRVITAHRPGQVLSLTVSTLQGTGTVQAHLGMAPVD
jgi:S1-C subfamily serine protease